MTRALGRVRALVAALAVLGTVPVAAQPETATPARALAPVPASDDPIWTEAPAPESAGKGSPELAPLIRRLEQSIVRLSATSLADRTRRAQGTGFVISSDGYVVTS